MLQAMVAMVGGSCRLEDYLEEAVIFINAWQRDMSPKPEPQVIKLVQDSKDFRDSLKL